MRIRHRYAPIVDAEQDDGVERPERLQIPSWQKSPTCSLHPVKNLGVALFPQCLCGLIVAASNNSLQKEIAVKRVARAAPAARGKLDLMARDQSRPKQNWQA
jgi:hypothetical protein